MARPRRRPHQEQSRAQPDPADPSDSKPEHNYERDGDSSAGSSVNGSAASDGDNGNDEYEDGQSGRRSGHRKLSKKAALKRLKSFRKGAHNMWSRVVNFVDQFLPDGEESQSQLSSSSATSLGQLGPGSGVALSEGEVRVGKRKGTDTRKGGDVNLNKSKESIHQHKHHRGKHQRDHEVGRDRDSVDQAEAQDPDADGEPEVLYINERAMTMMPPRLEERERERDRHRPRRRRRHEHRQSQSHTSVQQSTSEESIAREAVAAVRHPPTRRGRGRSSREEVQPETTARRPRRRSPHTKTARGEKPVERVSSDTTTTTSSAATDRDRTTSISLSRSSARAAKVKEVTIIPEATVPSDEGSEQSQHRHQSRRTSTRKHPSSTTSLEIKPRDKIAKSGKVGKICSATDSITISSAPKLSKAKEKPKEVSVEQNQNQTRDEARARGVPSPTGPTTESAGTGTQEVPKRKKHVTIDLKKNQLRWIQGSDRDSSIPRPRHRHRQRHRSRKSIATEEKIRIPFTQPEPETVTIRKHRYKKVAEPKPDVDDHQESEPPPPLPFTRTSSVTLVPDQPDPETEPGSQRQRQREQPRKELQSILKKPRHTITATVLDDDDDAAVESPDTDTVRGNRLRIRQARERLARNRAAEEAEVVEAEPGTELVPKKRFSIWDLRKPRAERGVPTMMMAGSIVFKREKVIRKPKPPKPEYRKVYVPRGDSDEESGAAPILREAKRSVKRGFWNFLDSIQGWTPFQDQDRGGRTRNRRQSGYRNGGESESDFSGSGSGSEEEEEIDVPKFDRERKRQLLSQAEKTIHIIDNMVAQNHRDSQVIFKKTRPKREAKDAEDRRAERVLRSYYPKTQFTSQFAHLLPQPMVGESMYREYRRNRPI